MADNTPKSTVLPPVVEEAVRRFKQAEDAYAKQRAQARDDLSFVAGNQWTTTSSAPSDDLELTVNLLQPFLRQITAEAREANPAIRVIPVSEGADEDIAEVFGGLIRHLEQKCDASNAYMTALWYAAAMGEGYLLLDTEYVASDSFEQDIVIKAAPNPEKVFIDPNHTLLDGCDANWGFVIEDLSHEAFKQAFPEAKLTEELSGNGWKLLSLPGDWIGEDAVRIARYYVKEQVKKTLYQVLEPLSGQVTTTTEKPEDDGLVIIQQRTTYETHVKRYVLNCMEVLDESPWPSKYLPIVKVTGDFYYVGGQAVQHGAIRFAKDPQKMYNYFVSRQTEMIDLAPKNSFIGATGQFANNPEKWANANRINYGFLDYTPTALNGQPVPPPSRVSGLDLSSFHAVASSVAGSYEQLKLVFGLHDAALGRPGNEISGVAIENRMMQSKKSTYHYFDNLLTALRCIGRQLVELIPIYYDTERWVRIVKPDTEEQVIAINSKTNNYKFDLTKGTYDVVIVTGPAYATKRQAALDALTSVAGILGPSSTVIADVIAGQIDSPVSKLIARRIKATIPKEVLAATGELDDMTDVAPAEQVAMLQQQMAQAQKELEQLELEKQEMKMKLTIAENTASLKLTELDLEHEREMKHLQHQDELAELEGRIKLKELELKERELVVREKQLELQALAAAGKMNKDALDIEISTAPIITNVEPGGHALDANLGGTI